MPKITTDLHMHTPLCGHAKGEPKEYAQHAVDVGLTEIGFSDHAPLFSHRDAGISMDHDQLPQYHQMIEEVRDAFADRLKISVAIEADFMPGYEDKTREMLKAYSYEYVIGSVHFIERWGFDDPIQMKEWEKREINEVYREYHHLLRLSAESKLFDILGHVDLVKKFDHHPTEDMSREIEENARVFKETGAVIEINTSGTYKPVREIYPSLHDLKIYRTQGVPITFGSDAHKPEHVGRDLDKGRELALAAGYKEYVVFKARTIDRTVAL